MEKNKLYAFMSASTIFMIIVVLVIWIFIYKDNKKEMQEGLLDMVEQTESSEYTAPTESSELTESVDISEFIEEPQFTLTQEKKSDVLSYLELYSGFDSFKQSEYYNEDSVINANWLNDSHGMLQCEYEIDAAVVSIRIITDCIEDSSIFVSDIDTQEELAVF